MTDVFLDATIKDYVRQCYPVARVSAAYGVDDDQLFRTSTDLPASFAAMAGPATFSTVYTAADKGGTTVSCTDAWTHISDRLSTRSCSTATPHRSARGRDTTPVMPSR
jgi:conjugal transfer mating pair stabilization protein TraG